MIKKQEQKHSYRKYTTRSNNFYPYICPEHETVLSQKQKIFNLKANVC